MNESKINKEKKTEGDVLQKQREVKEIIDKITKKLGVNPKFDASKQRIKDQYSIVNDHYKLDNFTVEITKLLFTPYADFEDQYAYYEGLEKYLNMSLKENKIEDLKSADTQILKTLSELEEVLLFKDEDKNTKIKNEDKYVTIKEKFVKSLYLLQLKVLLIGVSNLKDFMIDVVKQIELVKINETKVNPVNNTENEEKNELIKNNIKEFIKALTVKNELLKKIINEKVIEIDKSFQKHNNELEKYKKDIKNKNDAIIKENEKKQKEINELNKSSQTTVISSKTSNQKGQGQGQEQGQVPKQGGGSINYKHKYLKYKTKYVNLKNY